MLQPLLGQIRLVPYLFDLPGWKTCDGSTLAISQYPLLYDLLKPYFFSDSTRFALPDLRGRAVMATNNDRFYPIGMELGLEQVILRKEEMPAHNHILSAVMTEAKSNLPVQQVFASNQDSSFIYASASDTKDADLITISENSIINAGRQRPHDNMQPWMALKYIICVDGDKPGRDYVLYDGLIGEIILLAQDKLLPMNVKLCNGVKCTIGSLPELHRVIGNTFSSKSDKDYFQLPDLNQCLVAGSHATSHLLPQLKPGETTGEGVVKLNVNQLPPHSHQVQTTRNAARENVPLKLTSIFAETNDLLSRPVPVFGTYDGLQKVDMDVRMVVETGDGQAHNNKMPSLALPFYMITEGQDPLADGSDDANDFVGNIILFAGAKIPAGYLECNGAALLIQEYPVLYAVIKDFFTRTPGKTTFNLPDLRGRVPIGAGHGTNLTSRMLGEIGGSSTVALTGDELPVHNHQMRVSKKVANTANPKGNLPGSEPSFVSGRDRMRINLYDFQDKTGFMADESLSFTGKGDDHNNIQPTIGMRYLICVKGLSPLALG